MTTRDITGDIGPAFEMKCTVPMFSYSRPSAMLWQAIYEEFIRRGATHKEVIEWLQSKAPRWALDDDLGTAIRAIGSAWAETAPLPGG